MKKKQDNLMRKRNFKRDKEREREKKGEKFPTKNKNYFTIFFEPK